MKIFTIFFLVGLVLLALRVFLPGQVSDLFNYPEVLRVEGGNKLIAEVSHGKHAAFNVYNWFFFVLMACFCFAFFFIPIIYAEALDESSGSEGEKIFTSFFLSAVVSILMMMIIDGVKYFFVFSLPSPIGPTVMLLFSIVLLLSAELEITGNMLIDTFIFSFGILLVSFFFTLGLKVDFILVFPQFSIKLFLIMLAVLFLIFRIIFWIEKG